CYNRHLGRLVSATVWSPNATSRSYDRGTSEVFGVPRGDANLAGSLQRLRLNRGDKHQGHYQPLGKCRRIRSCVAKGRRGTLSPSYDGATSWMRGGAHVGSHAV